MPANQLDGAHARDAAGGANVCGNAFERHDGNGAGFLSDGGVFGGDDVHDDAALEHLRETALDGDGSGCFHTSNLSQDLSRGPGGGVGVDPEGPSPFSVGTAAGSPEGCSDGAKVGSGFWRQIGMSGFGVGVGTGVGRGFGVGASVGSGLGGTRGSGKRGSPAAESACERFQSGP